MPPPPKPLFRSVESVASGFFKSRDPGFDKINMKKRPAGVGFFLNVFEYQRLSEFSKGIQVVWDDGIPKVSPAPGRGYLSGDVIGG